LGLLFAGVLVLFSPDQTAAPIEKPSLTEQKPVSFEEKLERYQASFPEGNPLTEPYRAKSWVLETGLVEENSEQFRIMECESTPNLNPKICNRNYGCQAGMGLWGFIPSTWNETIVRMSKKGVWMPERCWQFVYLPVSDRRTEVVFDAECNFLAGLWLYNEDGNKHWIKYSGHCFLED